MSVWVIEDLDELEDETLRTGEHAKTAANLARLAEEGRVVGLSRAEVFTRAGGQWQLAGEPERAAELYQRAVDEGGAVQGDARAFLADALFELGREEEARSLLEQIRADGPTDPAVYHCVAETLEARRDLSAAHRWATNGVTLVLQDEKPSPSALDMLLRARFRVRRDMGLAEDDYDEMLDSLPDFE